MKKLVGRLIEKFILLYILLKMLLILATAPLNKDFKTDGQFYYVRLGEDYYLLTSETLALYALGVNTKPK